MKEIHELIYPNTNKEGIEQYEFFIFSSMILQMDKAVAELDYSYQYATIKTMFNEYKERNLEKIHVLESITNYIHLYYEDEN